VLFRSVQVGIKFVADNADWAAVERHFDSVLEDRAEQQRQDDLQADLDAQELAGDIRIFRDSQIS